MYLESGVGVFNDTQVAQDTYRDDLWMRQLIARDPNGIAKYHMPSPNHPHCYEITSFLSMFDNYRATHNTTWLSAAQGAWDIISENFLHIDGSSSLTEGTPDAGSDWPAKSYRIKPGTGTGETCCTTFWIKLNQRFLLMNPLNESYAAAIETSLYNALLRQMVFRSATPAGRNSIPSTSTRRQRGYVPYYSRGTLSQNIAAWMSQSLADSDASLPPRNSLSCSNGRSAGTWK